jgi:hypothetical protein
MPELRTEQELCLTSFRSRYAVDRSITRALEGVRADLDAPESALGRALDEATRRLRAGEPLEEALVPLSRQGTILQRLVTILERAEWASVAEAQTLLEELEEQARYARRLADRARVTLTLVRITLRVLVVANVTAMVVSALIPLWRSYYREHPLTYVAATLLGLLGFTYFALRLKHLEESL